MAIEKHVWSAIATFVEVWFLIGRMEGGRTVRSFQRWIYRNYYYGSSLGYFVRQRVKPAAWLLMGILGISMMMGANLGQSQVVAVSALVLGVLMVAVIWAFFRKARITAVRILPATGSVNEEVRYSVKVTNIGKRPLREISAKEWGDDPRPTQWEFMNLKEPGEETRNPFDRVFAFYRWKWLNERGGSWLAMGASEVAELEPGESKTVSLRFVPRRRGIVRFKDLRVQLPDPFGLFQRMRKVSCAEDEVLVIPRRYRLSSMNLSGQSELKVGGDTASTVRGEGGEFMGLREYRPGDSLRKIHWKAWARTGQPIVKEFEELRFPRYGLVLDTSLEESGPELLEEAISVAASFVSSMDREQCLLDLMFVQEEPAVFTAGRGVARADRLMEVLARVEGSEEIGYDSLSRLVLRYAVEMTACVVVLSGWSEARKVFVEALKRSSLSLEVYVIGVGEKPGDEELAAVHWLRWDSVQEDLLKRL